MECFFNKKIFYKKSLAIGGGMYNANALYFLVYKKKKMKRKIFLYAWLLLMWIMGALSSWVVRAEEPTFTITTHCEFLHRWWDFLPDDLSEIPSSEPWGRCGHPITVVSWTTFNDVMRDNQDFCTINPAWFYSNGCEMNYVNDDNDRDKPITQDIDIYIEYWLGEILISFDANGWEWYRGQLYLHQILQKMPKP